MKNLQFTTTILITVLLATACSKNESLSGHNHIHGNYKDANLVMVENTHVNIKLISAEGFDDPCFNISLDNIEKGTFRFTGTNTDWEYKDLQHGLHIFSYSCLHRCDNDKVSGSMVFQIDDGKTTQVISAVETGHCRYDFKMQVK